MEKSTLSGAVNTCNVFAPKYLYKQTSANSVDSLIGLFTTY